MDAWTRCQYGCRKRWKSVGDFGRRAEIGSCPGCGARSRRRHSRYSRCLQDLPAQGAIVALRILMTRWRCLNRSCARKTFSDQLPGVTIRHARRTFALAAFFKLFAHGAGGKPSERLISRLGMPASDDTLLRQLKRGAIRKTNDVRVLGIDDWSWRKGELRNRDGGSGTT